ncbi:MAG: 50S ribosomal protein L1 [Puniceicoccales bacterium]|jgi:large subunit ribosomal protein L1|nr:50S ribosomal protein L1 [Puniceicoccales bacterium]
MKKRSRLYRKNLEIIQREGGPRKPSLGEALQHLLATASAKFDETLELSLHLGVDPKQGDQMVRGIVRLPHGSGKAVRVLVFTEFPEAAREAGADHAGLSDLVTKIQGGWSEFDVAIATTAAMREVRSIAKILGPRGLMPSPKAGTVSDDVAAAVREVKAGRYEFKMDKTANLSLVLGRRSFGVDKLRENAVAAAGEVERICPAAVRGGRYILSATLSFTMGPGVSVEWSQLLQVA